MPVSIPEDLVRRTAAGDTVLFAGSGMSQPQLPGWEKLLRNMLDWAARQAIPLGDVDAIRELIGDGDLLLAAQEVRVKLGESRFCDCLREQLKGAKPTEAHKLIGELPFYAILTTNFDNLIEQALPGKDWHTQLDYRGQQLAMRDGEFLIMKVHGDLRRPETIVLGQADCELVNESGNRKEGGLPLAGSSSEPHSEVRLTVQCDGGVQAASSDRRDLVRRGGLREVGRETAANGIRMGEGRAWNRRTEVPLG